MRAIALALAGICAAAPIPKSLSLPFAVGEKLDYQVTLANGNKVGTAAMWVEGPVDVRGNSALLLRFDSRIRFLLVPGQSKSSSWFDTARGSSLRFLKHERNPLTHDDESIEIYPDERRWTSAAGVTGQTSSGEPLDELSFMYFIRTLPMTPGATYSFDRHFDPARNPVKVSVVRREVIPTPLGELHVIRVEMRVHDPRHYAGEGLIKLHLTDDACRIPVRIESRMPVIGTAVLTIVSAHTSCWR
jgi:hypothetical protein